MPKFPTPVPEKEKSLNDFKPTYSCRFHPTDWFHEVGCPHQAWGNDDLQKALNSAKQSNAYLVYLLSNQQKSQSFNEGYLKALDETKKAVEDFDPTDMSRFGSAGAGMVKASMLRYFDSKLEELRKGK